MMPDAPGSSLPPKMTRISSELPRNARHIALGWLEAGRIRHHLKNNLGIRRNLVLFIGYCASTRWARNHVWPQPGQHLGEPHEVRAHIASH